MPIPAAEFWKRKLAAFLHDPPSKALDIKTHGERADSAFRRAGFTDDEVGRYFKGADHTAAAADRLPWPHWRSGNLICAFDGVRNTFVHPLGGSDGERLPLPFHREFPSAELGIEGENSVQPLLAEESLAQLDGETDRWRARFFAHWRLWPKHAAEKDYRLSLLPADTRIPDHSIWTHMQIVSAIGGCEQDGRLQPAFLKFQLGPVQTFIGAARSIRDLWSGSYLLSWLMAAGLKALAEKVGPDAVIYPNLRGQPLFDLHCRKDFWAQLRIGSLSVWESLNLENRELLTPNLPNVFLAVVPADQATTLGHVVTDAIRAEWHRIASAVWSTCDEAGLTADESGISRVDRKARFDAQIKGFLSLSWQATPWPESLDKALRLADRFDANLPIQQARLRVQAIVEMAEKQMPQDHRDGRYYTGGNEGPKTHLNNIGLGWSVILALNTWQLDAVRQTHAVDANNSGNSQPGTFNNKDALTGREEAVAGGRVWSDRASNRATENGGPWKSLFKHDDWLGAPTLVKRVWHFAYLARKPWTLGTDAGRFPMPNTRGVAAHTPETDCGDDESAQDAPPAEKYFAVLAFDGDEIGKWISGEKAPPISSLLADYQDGSGGRTGAREYFERTSDPDNRGTLKDRYHSFRSARRPLSPSYHLQFSEALSNFALLCARPIVEAFDGRLIYAGGDDVAALLPADTAIRCAQALRAAFQGQDPGVAGIKSASDGFLTLNDYVDQNRRPIPFIVPGPAADCSVGIAMAHFKAPLQDVVRAAQAAEKRAKNKLDRSAVAVSLFKRSGEILEWGAKWDDGGLALFDAILTAMEKQELSAKFPHRLCELLEVYRNDSAPLVAQAKIFTDDPAFSTQLDELIRREFAHVLGRQHGPRWPEKKDAREALVHTLSNALACHLGQLGKEKPTEAGLSPQEKLQRLTGLLTAVAFAHRTSEKPVTDSAPNGSTP